VALKAHPFNLQNRQVAKTPYIHGEWFQVYISLLFHLNRGVDRLLAAFISTLQATDIRKDINDLAWSAVPPCTHGLACRAVYADPCSQSKVFLFTPSNGSGPQFY